MLHGKFGNNMKVLLTGSEGYIGSRLIQVLLNEGFDVTGLDTNFYAEGQLYNPEKKSYELVTKDVRAITTEDLKGFDAIVHLAEISNDPLGQNDPELTFEINHKGTMNLAASAKAAGVSRFIYFSSCSVYGASDNISDESSATNPLTAYAKSKIMNENALQEMADDTFHPTMFRNATVFGASPRMRFDLVVNDLSATAYIYKIIKMSSDGTPWRPFVHVMDVSKAVVMTLKSPVEKISNQLFNIGSDDNNYQIRNVAEIIASVFPGCTTEFGDSSGDKRNYRVGFKKITEVLPGFTCDWNVKKGAEELKEIFDSIQMTEEIYKSRLYTRLKQIEYLKENKIVDEHLYWL